MNGLEEIEGLGPASAERLRAIGVTTASALFDQCHTPEQIRELAEWAGIHANKVRRWSYHAALLRIPGVDGRSAGLLVDLHLYSARDVAAQDTEDLALRLAEANVRDRRLAHPPSLGQVQAWIEAAKRLSEEGP